MMNPSSDKGTVGDASCRLIQETGVEESRAASGLSHLRLIATTPSPEVFCHAQTCIVGRRTSLPQSTRRSTHDFLAGDSKPAAEAHPGRKRSAHRLSTEEGALGDVAVDDSTRATGEERTMPKRFKNSYMFFSLEKYSEIREEHSRQGKCLKSTSVSKEISARWKAMDATEREKWTKMAVADKQRYEAEMSTFRLARAKAKLPKKLKDPHAPKRPVSAFLSFSNRRRHSLKKKHPSSTNSDLSKILSTQWQQLDPGLKDKYVREEAQLRDKYKMDMAAWKRTKKRRRDTKIVMDDLGFPEIPTVDGALFDSPPQVDLSSSSNAAPRNTLPNMSLSDLGADLGVGGTAVHDFSILSLPSHLPAVNDPADDQARQYMHFLPTAAVPSFNPALSARVSRQQLLLLAQQQQRQQMNLPQMSSMNPHQLQDTRHGLLASLGIQQQPPAVTQNQHMFQSPLASSSLMSPFTMPPMSHRPPHPSQQLSQPPLSPPRIGFLPTATNAAIAPDGAASAMNMEKPPHDDHEVDDDESRLEPTPLPPSYDKGTIR